MIKQVDGKWCLFTKDGSRKLGCHDTKAEAEEQERVVEQKSAATVSSSVKHARSFRGLLSGAVRVATFQGREHLVVPVVALVQGVIHASNSAAPELVLAEEFAKVPQGWNGRPVMMNHPEDDGGKISANEPAVLEQWQMGTVFHAAVSKDKLTMEAWLDVPKIARMGGEAARVLERARSGAGEPVEVSVGVFVDSQPVSGEMDGARYSAVWRDLVPDHLAMLSEGTKGACSVEMGCGAPRAAAGKGSTMKNLKDKIAALRAKFQPTATAEEDPGASDQQLRQLLDQALFAEEPGYLGIEAVFPEATQVVYAVAPEGELQFLRRTYSLAEDGTTVKLGGGAEEVRPTTKYEPVAASGASQAPPCGCGGGRAAREPEPPKEASMKTKERVAAIIASGKTCFTAASAATLEQLPEEELKALEAHVTKLSETPTPAPAETPAPVETPAPADAPATPTPEEEQAAFLAKHPDLAEIVTQHKAAAASKRTDLVTKLVGAQKVYSEAELKALSTSQLEKLAALAVKPSVDHTLHNPPRSAEGDSDVPAPIDMVARIKAAREKKTA